MTLPSLFFIEPRTTITSSSLRMGTARTPCLFLWVYRSKYAKSTTYDHRNAYIYTSSSEYISHGNIDTHVYHIHMYDSHCEYDPHTHTHTWCASTYSTRRMTHTHTTPNPHTISPSPFTKNDAHTHTPKFTHLNSALSGADMIFRRSLLGAVKCAFLDLRLLLETLLENFISLLLLCAHCSSSTQIDSSITRALGTLNSLGLRVRVRVPG